MKTEAEIRDAVRSWDIAASMEPDETFNSDERTELIRMKVRARWFRDALEWVLDE